MQKITAVVLIANFILLSFGNFTLVEAACFSFSNGNMLTKSQIAAIAGKPEQTFENPAEYRFYLDGGKTAYQLLSD